MHIRELPVSTVFRVGAFESPRSTRDSGPKFGSGRCVFGSGHGTGTRTRGRLECARTARVCARRRLSRSLIERTGRFSPFSAILRRRWRGQNEIRRRVSGRTGSGIRKVTEGGRRQEDSLTRRHRNPPPPADKHYPSPHRRCVAVTSRFVDLIRNPLGGRQSRRFGSNGASARRSAGGRS